MTKDWNEPTPKNTVNNEIYSFTVLRVVRTAVAVAAAWFYCIESSKDCSSSSCSLVLLSLQIISTINTKGNHFSRTPYIQAEEYIIDLTYERTSLTMI